MKYALTFSILIIALYPQTASSKQAATAIARIHTTVLPSLSISRTQDLDLGTALAGAVATQVDADQGARFEVRGEAGKAFTVVLPQEVEIASVQTPGQAIRVNSFRSSSNNGRLDAHGRGELRVGATREALNASQAAGDYEGTFTVTVTYQ